MKTVQKSVLIWFSPQEMFDLVTDVAQYPSFLPWCSHANVLDEDSSGMTAEVGVAFAGMQKSFTTRNTHTAPSSITMELVDGPFSHFHGVWTFDPVGSATASAPASERACKVTFTLEYGFSNIFIAKVVGAAFDKIAASMVDAFVQRAQQVYG